MHTEVSPEGLDNGLFCVPYHNGQLPAPACQDVGDGVLLLLVDEVVRPFVTLVVVPSDVGQSGTS